MNMLPSDPVMLLSYVNMKLRDQYAFCDDFDISKQEIIEKLKNIDYIYDIEKNQFK